MGRFEIWKQPTNKEHSLHTNFTHALSPEKTSISYTEHMSYFAYACKTEGKNGISRLISALCVNCLNSIPEYSRIIDYSIIWMCIWCGLL